MGPEWIVTVAKIDWQPQLPVLVVLDSALEATMLALTSSHPEFCDDEPFFFQRPESYLAQTIITSAQALRTLLNAYQVAQDRYADLSDKRQQ